MALFQRLKDLCSLFAKSQNDFARTIGLPQTTFLGYLNEAGQSKVKMETFNTILAKFPQVRRDWLLWGEGPMLKEDFESKPEAQPQQALAAIGFASCGKEGWSGRMTHSTVVAAPHLWPDMFCVIASGESMIPEGIGHGHYVFCCPKIPPVPGECVYVETIEGKGALKRFLGEKAINGKGVGITLLGWLDKDDNGLQEPFQLTIDKINVKTFAPVVYIQRRV